MRAKDWTGFFTMLLNHMECDLSSMKLCQYQINDVKSDQEDLKNKCQTKKILTKNKMD